MDVSKFPDSRITQKIDIDNKAHLRYQVAHWCRLIDASICGAALSRRSSKTKADADTHQTVFDSAALKKQLLTFYLLRYCKIPGFVGMTWW
jgi:hypothetical protein